MQTQYEARVDSKHRVVLRGTGSGRFLVNHRRDGSIILKPLELAHSASVRKARLERVISKAKANGEKIPPGVGLITFPVLTPAQRAKINRHAKQMKVPAKKVRKAAA